MLEMTIGLGVIYAAILLTQSQRRVWTPIVVRDETHLTVRPAQAHRHPVRF